MSIENIFLEIISWICLIYDLNFSYLVLFSSLIYRSLFSNIGNKEHRILRLNWYRLIKHIDWLNRSFKLSIAFKSLVSTIIGLLLSINSRSSDLKYSSKWTLFMIILSSNLIYSFIKSTTNCCIFLLIIFESINLSSVRADREVLLFFNSFFLLIFNFNFFCLTSKNIFLINISTSPVFR